MKKSPILAICFATLLTTTLLVLALSVPVATSSGAGNTAQGFATPF